MTEVDAVLPEGISASSIATKNSDNCETLENSKTKTVEAEIKKVIVDDADGTKLKKSGADKHEIQESGQEEQIDGAGDDNDNTSSNNNENSNGSTNHINDTNSKKVTHAAGEEQTAVKVAADDCEAMEVVEDEDGIEDTEGEDDSQITTSTDNKTAALTVDEDDDEEGEAEAEEDDTSMNGIDKLKVTPGASTSENSLDTGDPLEKTVTAKKLESNAASEENVAPATSAKPEGGDDDSAVATSQHGESKTATTIDSEEDSSRLSDKPETAEDSQNSTSNKPTEATTPPRASNGDGKVDDEPMDTSEVEEKANGIDKCSPPAATIPAPSKEVNDTSGIVNLDDSDDEIAECEPTPAAKTNEIPNGPVTVQPTSQVKASALTTDDAVVIASDSEPEMTDPVSNKPIAAVPLMPPTFAPVALAPPAPVPTTLVPVAHAVTPIDDDDDDDCVVIEDDSPPEAIKRKGVGEPEDLPPNKRQRSLTPANITMGQLTIKDARSLMPQDAIAANVKKDAIYPVTITSANQGPPKLVPMSTPTTTLGVNMNTGLSAPLAANLSFPGLPSMTNNANLLPGLTDDMFVLEAPSFIVPYIYEKPPTDNIREIVRAIEQKYALTAEDLAEADKFDEFDMTTEQNKEEKPTSEEANVKKKKKDDNDDSWSEQSEEDDDDDDDDSESGMRTKVLIKEASDDLTAIKGAIKPAAAVTQSGASANSAKPGQENYFESPLGKFFMDIGVGLVQEYVQADLLRLQKRKLRKSLSKNTKDYERAINALSGNLQASREKNMPYKFTMKRCEFCNFKSESALAMANHYETPHMNGVMYKCNFCTFEIRNATEIVYHMEAMHNIKARLIKPLPYHQCPNCGFEDNGKAKLARHQPVCAKKFRPELNLSPPNDWEAPAKIPRIKPRHGLVGTATAYQAMAAQAAAQKAALATIQAQQAQAAQARNLQAAALAAQNAAKMRARAPNIPKPGPTPNVGPMRGMPTPQRNPISTNVVLPNNYQLAAGQLVQQASKKSVGGQPSISITPLPRQNAAVNVAAPSASTSKMPQNTGMKPGQSPSGGNSKAQFVICEICDGYIKDLEQLRNHMQWMHKVKIHPKMIYNRPPLNCQKCQFRFFTDQGLERHLLGSHGLVTSSMQEAANKGKDAGRCPICGRMYQWKLLNHVSRDHHMTLKPAHLSYKCTVCTATFGMYKQFETHVYTAHSSVAKKAMDNKKTGNPNANAGNNASGSLPRNNLNPNDSLLKPLKINDEITIIPQPASKPRITNMESHVID